MKTLIAKNLTKNVVNEGGYKVELFEEIEFEIDLNKSKIYSFLGPTGSGKSALLKVLAGLDDDFEGSINKIEDGIGYIPSNPSSFPWMSLRESLSFVIDQKVSESKLQELSDLVGLSGYEDHHPINSSLGFRFRLSLAMCLIKEPSILLLDEPFDEFRKEVKSDIYKLLRKIVNQKSIPIIIATSNISEAILLADNVMLMKSNPGRIIEDIDISHEELMNKELMHEYRIKIENSLESHQTEYGKSNLLF